jgi:hypothetical protein
MGGFRRRRQFPFPGPILQEQPRGRKRGHQHFPVPSATAEMFRPHSPAGEGVCRPLVQVATEDLRELCLTIIRLRWAPRGAVWG